MKILNFGDNMAIEDEILVDGKNVTFQLIVSGNPFKGLSKIALILPPKYDIDLLGKRKTIEEEIKKRYKVNHFLYPD